MLIYDFDEQGRRKRLLFVDPVEVIAVHRVEDVRPALRRVQQAAMDGLYAAGYLSYEAAPAFDPAFKVQAGARLPLLWFGLFRGPSAISARSTDRSVEVSGWEPAIERETYDSHIAEIRRAIAAGITYQTNYTLRLRAHFRGDERAFYERLRASQDAAYCAYLNLGRYHILSASPELFFHWDGDRIVTRPMKGTARRGRWPEEDDERAAWLATSEKNRAENLMIVDLLRNDLGRIATPGSIHVPELFTIERYRTVLQMTSTVAARTRPGVTLDDIFAALFPCGSVTGAPKISTMRLIAALEPAPREVYCGAIGLVSPGGRALFNVAIRTVWIDARTGSAEYGIGGGITWDSTAAAEYDEALGKAALLTEEWPDFSLLETLLLKQGEYVLLQRHLKRLAASARYFGIPFSPEAAQTALSDHAKNLPDGAHRVRLLVSQEGEIHVESQPLDQQFPTERQPLPVRLAGEPISRHNRFLYHKTTHRAMYESRRSAYPDVFDVLLANEEGEITEFTTGNLVVEIDGQRWTPPRESGLLAGTLRAELIEHGAIRERVITSADLYRASRLWLINSVRGWVPVRLVSPHERSE